MIKKLFLISLTIGTIVVLGIVVDRYFVFLRKAHSTFDNYYAFRGCKQLIQRTETYGICKTDRGQTIKIVKFQGRWYLDGDLPTCLLHICL